MVKEANFCCGAGHIIQNSSQIEALVQRGLFVDAGAVERAAQARMDAAKDARRETPSALRFINLATKRLARLLYNLANETDAQPKILEVVKTLNFASEVNPDVALATVLLNQDAASYSVRHCVDTASSRPSSGAQ